MKVWTLAHIDEAVVAIYEADLLSRRIAIAVSNFSGVSAFSLPLLKKRAAATSFAQSAKMNVDGLPNYR